MKTVKQESLIKKATPGYIAATSDLIEPWQHEEEGVDPFHFPCGFCSVWEPLAVRKRGHGVTGFTLPIQRIASNPENF